MTVEDLMAYVGTDDIEFAGTCLNEATLMVDAYIGSQEVPQVARERAVLETASELFHRRNAPNGVAQFASFDGAPVRIARDPMVGAYPILNRWMVTGL